MNCKTLFLILVCLVFNATLSLSQDTGFMDSLKTVMQTAEEDSTRLKAQIKLAAQYWYTQPDTAYFIAKDAYAKAKIGNYTKRMANAENGMGVSSYYRGDYPLALKHLLACLKLGELIDDKSGIAKVLGNIGVIFFEQGDYPMAMKYYFKTLKMNEELGSKNLQAITSGNIGIVYHRQEKYYKALEYYFKALKLDEEEENRSGVAGDYVYIGLIYSDLGEYARALEFYFKSLTIQEELVNKFGITGTLINIGEVYSLQKKYREAEAYLLRALEISREVKYLLSEQFCHEHLSTLYEQTGQYKKAYEHHMEYSIAKDSLFNEEKSKEIGKLEAKHEFEKAEAERKRTEEEQIDREASTKSRRDNLQYSGILIFIVLLFGGVFMLGRFSMPIRLAEGLTFFAFLLFFEFTLVLLDPYIENYSGGEPAYKLLFNAMLAGMIFPLHSFFETRLKTRIAKE